MSTELYAQVAHGRTADAVVVQIEGLILEGILRVGDRLPGERALAAKFEISRPILREALKTLETRGLLVSRHGGGTHVADVIGQVFSQPVMELISRHRKATLDYLEYRREIEGLTAGYAADRATGADKNLLKRVIANMHSAHRDKDFRTEAALDVEFHSAVSECAHNIILLHTLRSCYRLLSDGVFYNRTLIYTFPGAREKLLAQHTAIAEAIFEGDRNAARTAAQTHIDFVAAAIHDAERSSDWERVSRLRLKQRSPASPASHKPDIDAEKVT